MRGFGLSARNVAKALLLYGGLAGGLYALGWWIGGVRLDAGDRRPGRGRLAVPGRADGPRAIGDQQHRT